MLNILQTLSSLTFKIIPQIRNQYIHVIEKKTELGRNLSCGIFNIMILDIFYLSDSTSCSIYYIVLGGKILQALKAVVNSRHNKYKFV